MNDLKQIVAEYYPHIDDVDTDWVLRLFSEDAVYQRADALYEGLPAIASFFREKRKIRGTHTVERMWSDPDSLTVIATGRFTGRGDSGDSRSVGFADVWQFNDAGLVVQRQTYLALGHEYVER